MYLQMYVHTCICFVCVYYYDNIHALSQDLILHDAISRKAGVFLRLSSGLSTNGVLDMLELFFDLHYL